MTSALSARSASMEAGLAELIDELTAKLHTGESPDLEAFAAAHPEHAAKIRELGPALQLLQHLGPPGDVTELPGFKAGVLGDYRLVREVGRGGMGVVYEAEQISLNRSVALKILPFAATIDPRQLQRFQNEARAAASLHHEHIVPVYGVGCERGVHYYAMQFIAGRPLSDLIAQLSRGQGDSVPVASAPTAPEARATTIPDFGNRAYWRRVAELIAQAADALEYAHSMGVVHRDVKPGNLLLDNHGKLWVADFGLAKFGADVGVTMTGDLLGTLRYMSPEQALAKHGLVDHRTDVYSLGATLYELLTLRPAFAATDRQELLRQIAFEEPEPLRKRNRAVPVELETIVLAAMEKDPGVRYASAQGLAADLRRFLNDEPLQKRRPSVIQRTRKWARRHVAVVWAATAVLALAVAALVVCTVLIERKRAEASSNFHAAREQERLANERAAELERTSRNLAQTSRQLAQTYMRLARTQLMQASLLPEGTKRSAQVADAALVFRQALPLFERLTATFTEECGYWEELAVCHLVLNALLDSMGTRPQLEECNRAVTLFEEAASRFSSVPMFRSVLASHYGYLGEYEKQAGRHQRAEQLYRRAIDLHETLVTERPSNALYRLNLARRLEKLRELYGEPGQLMEALAIIRRAVAVMEAMPQPDNDWDPDAEWFITKGHMLRHFGFAQLRVSDIEGARSSFRMAATVFEHIGPTHREALHFWADSIRMWADILTRLGRDEEAERAYREAARIFDQMLTDFPTIPPVTSFEVIQGYTQLVAFLTRRNRVEEAKVVYQRAKEVHGLLLKLTAKDAKGILTLIWTERLMIDAAMGLPADEGK